MDRLAAMEVFVRVVETGSFSGAARQMQIGQPSVSKAVAQLEERLGVQLLARSTRGIVAPTDTGLNLYERFRHIVDDLNEAELAARGTGAALSGRLRVSAGITFSRLHIFPGLENFMRSHPHLMIDVLTDDKYVNVLAEGVDVALRMGPLEDSSLTARKIGESRRSPFATLAYLDRSGEPSLPTDLVGREVFGSPAPERSWDFRKDGVTVPVSVGSRLTVTGGEGMRSAVLAGLGMAISSEWLFSSELKAGVVRAALSDWQLPLAEFWAVFPAGRRPSAKARALTSFVEGEILKALAPTRWIASDEQNTAADYPQEPNDERWQ
jgi:DNA-binding transcriptional LysR family regulator